jgi:clan AA aspartic protease (TIGR02281 family)
MSKTNIIFTAVTLSVISFFVFYFTTPLAHKPSAVTTGVTIPQIRSNTTINRNESIPAGSLQDSGSPNNLDTPPLMLHEDSQIVSSTKSQVTVRYYSRSNLHNLKLLNIIVNDIPVEMIFDTGASFIVFNAETMNRIGARHFLESRVTQTPAGLTTAYMFRVPSIKLGSIELRNIECAYVPTSPINLLGGSFLSNFTYSINEEDQTITFIPRGEKIQYTSTGIQASPGQGWAEINGVKYLYNNGKFEKQ